METKLAHRCQICSAICHSSLFYVALASWRYEETFRFAYKLHHMEMQHFESTFAFVCIFQKSSTYFNVHYLILW